MHKQNIFNLPDHTECDDSNGYVLSHITGNYAM